MQVFNVFCHILFVSQYFLIWKDPEIPLQNIVNHSNHHSYTFHQISVIFHPETYTLPYLEWTLNPDKHPPTSSVTTALFLFFCGFFIFFGYCFIYYHIWKQTLDPDKHPPTPSSIVSTISIFSRFFHIFWILFRLLPYLEVDPGP